MKAYKVFNPDWTCRGFRFEVGLTYEENVKPELCNRGFHACKNIADCFSYYSFNPNNKVAEVVLLGIIIGQDEEKSATNKIKIVRELTWIEVLQLANSGRVNTGLGNSGDRNSGDRNSGDSNSGDRNSGNRNSGNRNSGDRNSGDSNSGDRNSGDSNSGYSNSGDSNSGYSNSGDFNSTPPEYANYFNKNCKITVWENAQKPDFINNVVLNIWISFDEMTDEEKMQYPKAFGCDGYLKKFGYKEAWQNAFKEADENDIKLLKSLPNFDAIVFEEITGIKID